MQAARGEIRDAIVDYLADCANDASAVEIQRALSRSRGESIPASSVRSYLGNNTPAMFRRTRRGRYRLANDHPRLFASEQKSEDKDSEPDALFRFNQATLYRADCVEWLACQADNSYHAVVTDPPYGVAEYSPKEKAKLELGKGGVWRIPPSFDGFVRQPVPRFTVIDDDGRSQLYRFYRRWARALLRVVVPGANVVVASNPLLSYIVSAAVTSGGFERRGEIIRLVMTMRGGDRPKNAHEEYPGVSVMPRSMWEPWLVFRKPLDGRVKDNLKKWGTGGFRRPGKDRPFGDVIQSHPTNKAERRIANHPSLKPQRFLRQIVRGSLALGEGVVLDPFAGSASTLAAAEAVGYASAGVELDYGYFTLGCKSLSPLASFEV